MTTKEPNKCSLQLTTERRQAMATTQAKNYQENVVRLFFSLINTELNQET